MTNIEKLKYYRQTHKLSLRQLYEKLVPIAELDPDRKISLGALENWEQGRRQTIPYWVMNFIEGKSS